VARTSSAVMNAEKAYLKAPGADGISLYGHLTEVLATMLEKGEKDALGSIEALSMKAKGTHFTPASAVAPPAPALEPVADATKWHETSGALLTSTAPVEGEEAAGFNPNLVKDSATFAAAGVSLPKEEVYRVYLSLHKLQKTKELESIRFFGKVLGTEADYYIAEASFPAAEDEAELPVMEVPIEEKGTGCNMFCYFATNDPAGEWTELPLVRPDQLAAAGLIRKLFSGKLDAPVRAYPPFPGKEKEYLRAQIARIAAATVLSPAGKYAIEEESEPKKVIPFENEDAPYKPAAAAAMLEPASWVKYNYGILGIGRCTHPPPPEEEEEEGAPKEKPVLESEVAPLTPISGDEWATQVLDHAGGGAAVAVARSVLWPGAICATVNAEDACANMYIGYGQCMLPAPFVVQPPPPIMQEPDDVVEQVDMPLAQENEPVLAAAKAALLETVTAEAEAAAAEE